MRGRVENLHALLPVTFCLAHQPRVTLEFVIDTGFTGSLTMPPAAVRAMGLPYEQHIETSLADDSDASLPLHRATIVWNGEERDVWVIAAGSRPLLGTDLLDGFELVAQFAEGGVVTVRAME